MPNFLAEERENLKLYEEAVMVNSVGRKAILGIQKVRNGPLR